MDGVIISASDYTLKKFVDLDKVAPLLLENKTLPKSVRALIKASRKTKNKDIFISALLKLDLEGFAQFLVALEKVGDENHRGVLNVLSTELSRADISATKPSDLEAVKTIERIQRTYFKKSLHQGLPEGEQGASSQVASGTQDPSDEGITYTTPPSPDPLMPRPSPDIETQTFSRESCEIFYSTVHGVTVTIPEQAFPPGISEFVLSMTASLESSSLTLDCEQYTPCSAIITLKCDPPIEEFADYVTVEIPHSALNVDANQDHLCVVSAPDSGDGARFEEDQNISVEFTDKYAEFKTKHFTRYLAVFSKKRRIQNSFSVIRSKYYLELTKNKSKSLDASASCTSSSSEVELRRFHSHPVSRSTHSYGNVEFYLSMFFPKITAHQNLGKVLFSVAYCAVPTAQLELQWYAEKLLDVHNLESFEQCEFRRITFDKPYLEFTPPCLIEDGWKVEATAKPPEIQKQDVDMFFSQNEEQRRLSTFLPHCLYCVERTSAVPSGHLNAQISVEGATCHGKKVSFTITSTSTSADPTSLKHTAPTIADMYPPDSLIRQAIADDIKPDHVMLSLDDRDSVTLLAELSFHLQLKWKEVATNLAIATVTMDTIEAGNTSGKLYELVFEMLKTWVEQNYPNTSLAILLGSLERAGVKVHQRRWCQTHAGCSPSGGVAKGCGLTALLRTKIPIKITSHWKFVARFLGITECEIDNISEDSQKLFQQCQEMLQLFEGRDLPMWRLRDAIHGLYEHTGTHYLRDAWWFTDS